MVGAHNGRGLVSEMKRQRAREIAARRRLMLRAVALRVVAALTLAAAVVATVYGVRVLVHARAIDRGMQVAQASLASSTSTGLDAGLRSLERNLDLEPHHPESIGLIASLRTQQAARGLVELQVAREAVARAESLDQPQAPACAAILAFLVGERELAEAVLAQPATHELAQLHQHWLAGALALEQPYAQAPIRAATTRLQAFLDTAPEQVPQRRLLAQLHARQADFDAALATVEGGREYADGHQGLLADELLFRALAGRTGVVEAADLLTGNAAAPAQDRARARLAAGIADLRDGRHRRGAKKIDDALGLAPVWDRSARLYALEALLGANETSRARTLIDRAGFDGLAKQLLGAWIDYLHGQARVALSTLATLPQQLPRVAHLQALALVDEGRIAEAGRWVEFARKSLSHREDLRVAQERVAVASGDASALLRLEQLAKRQPHAHRVWTALGEAYAGLDEPTLAQRRALRKAVERATVQEPFAGHAAFLLAQLDVEVAHKDPKRIEAALTSLAAAVKLAPSVPRVRFAQASFLAHIGRNADAVATLQPAITHTADGGAPLLLLARTSLIHARQHGSPVSADLPAWLEEVGRRDGDSVQLQVAWADYELWLGTPEGLARSRRRVEVVLEQDAQHVQARVIHARGLLRQGDPAAAILTLRRGIRSTMRTVDGPLYIAWSEVALAQGKRRRGASLAYKGWSKMVALPESPAVLMATAPVVAGHWLTLGQARVAASVARGLVKRAPFSSAAWTLRGDCLAAAGKQGAAREAYANSKS